MGVMEAEEGITCLSPLSEACGRREHVLVPCLLCFVTTTGQEQLDSGLPCNSQLAPTAVCLLAATDQALGTMWHCWKGQAEP